MRSCQLDGVVDSCVFVEVNVVSRSEAVSVCESQHAYVSPIHDQSLNDYIMQTAVASNMMGGVQNEIVWMTDGVSPIECPVLKLVTKPQYNSIYFLEKVHPRAGAMETERYIEVTFIFSADGGYRWSDGSDVEYLNFAPGFPDSSFGECVAMSVGLFTGKWMNVDCALPLPYFCTKPAGSYNETIVPEGCEDSEFFPGDEARSDIISPTWGSSTGPVHCYYALMDRNRTKKFTVEVLLFESNSCCDTLTIYDGLFGTTVLKTLTGYHGNTSIVVTGSSNAIRMEWNATSGAHVRGWHARVGSVW